MQISTERLALRHFKESDHAFTYRLLNDDSFIQNIGDKEIKTSHDAIQYLVNGPMASYKAHGFGLNLICLKGCQTPIGMCGLLKRPDFEYADLGYALLPEHCGQGYAQEASLAVLKDGYERHHLPVIAAITSPSNVSSNQLLKRLGFTLKSAIEYYSKVNNYYEKATSCSP